MGKVIATDLDGTLFYPKHPVRMIGKSYLDFLRSHIDNGGKVIIVSGRNRDFSQLVEDKIGRPVDFICCNSAYIRYNGEILRKKSIDVKYIDILNTIKQKFQIMFNMLMSENAPLYVDTGKGKKAGIVRFITRIYFLVQGVYAENYVMDDGTLITKQIKDDKGYKAMIFCGWTKKGKEIARYVAEFIQEQYPEVTATYSEGVVEITPRDCYKANGLALICEKGNINPDDVYVVGDSGNDISMFNAFYEHSFCMRHAPEHVRCHAKYTIKKFNHLEKYLK